MVTIPQEILVEWIKSLGVEVNQTTSITADDNPYADIETGLVVKTTFNEWLEIEESDELHL